MICIVLSSSRHATQDYGPLRHAGRFNNAINFLTPSNQLLTLHRYGHGLSPMGWLVDKTDFDHLTQITSPNEQPIFTSNGITFQNMELRNRSNSLNMTLSGRGKIPSKPLRQVLFCSPVETGLFGRLDNTTHSQPAGEMAQLQQIFLQWLQGEKVDWSDFVGKGPGLTPSNDDSLVGMLLVAYADSRINPASLAPFFQKTQPLETLTTLVSQHYLQYAAQGVFSSPLQAIAHGLLAPQALLPAVKELLSVGHYSGPDTLLGIWLATECISRCYPEPHHKII